MLTLLTIQRFYLKDVAYYQWRLNYRANTATGSQGGTLGCVYECGWYYVLTHQFSDRPREVFESFDEMIEWLTNRYGMAPTVLTEEKTNLISKRKRK